MRGVVWRIAVFFSPSSFFPLVFHRGPPLRGPCFESTLRAITVLLAILASLLANQALVVALWSCFVHTLFTRVTPCWQGSAIKSLGDSAMAPFFFQLSNPNPLYWRARQNVLCEGSQKEATCEASIPNGPRRKSFFATVLTKLFLCIRYSSSAIIQP